MSKIHDTITRVREILNLLDEDDPDKNEILETETDLFKLIDWCIRKDEEFLVAAEMNKDLSALYKHRQGALENRSDGIRSILQALMDTGNLLSHKGVYGTATIKDLAPKLIITNISLLPRHCIKVEEKPIMAEVKKALEAGDLNGAEWSNGGISLTIRRK